MRSARPILVTALVFLFFAEGQRALFSSLYILLRDATEPTLQPEIFLLATMPLLALLLPLLPLGRWLDRSSAAAVAAAAVAIVRVPVTLPDPGVRLVAGALVLAGTATYLTWAVGHVDRRPLAAGAVLGLALDQLLRSAGGSWDLSLQPEWLPAQATLSLALIALALLWLIEARRERRAGASRQDLERRSGGLRLRGALALGTLLFLDLHVVGLSPVAARLSGVEAATAGLALAAAGALALGLLLAGRGSLDLRRTALALVAVIGAAIVGGWWGGGGLGLALLAAGHSSALLLAARTLEPASGRRGRGVSSIALLVLVLWTAAYSVTLLGTDTVDLPGSAILWVLGAALLFLAGCFLLLPHRSEVPRPGPALAGALAALAVVAVAALLSARDDPGGALAKPDAPADRVPAEWIPSYRVPDDQAGGVAAVPGLDARYGYGSDGRFDPDRLADAIAAISADPVTVRNVGVGAPFAYGVDLPRLLARRLQAAATFVPRRAPLLGSVRVRRSPDQGPRPEGGPAEVVEPTSSSR